MNWLNLLANKKPINKSPWVYLLAVIVVAGLLVFWFSLQPNIKARDFLPDNTSFYFEWSDSRAWTRADIWPFKDVLLQGPEQNLIKLQDILEDNFQQLQEIVWFKLEGDEQDYYLLKFNNPLRKKQVEQINNKDETQKVWQIKHDVYLLSPTDSLINQLPKQIVNKFSLASGREGINIYFNLSQTPAWLSFFGEFLQNRFQSNDTFVNLDFNHDQIDIFQSATTTSQDKDWQHWQLPNDFEAVMAFGDDAPDDFVKHQLWPVLLTDFPSYYFEEFSSQLANSLLVVDDQRWLVASTTDWQQLVNDYANTFGVEEQEKLLPDRTRYIELVRKEDFIVANKEFVGSKYWQAGEFFGTSLADRHYLSNSEEFIQETIVGRQLSDGLWQNCLSEDIKIDSFMFVKAKLADKIGLKQVFNGKVQQVGLYSYHNLQVSGLKLCY